MVKPKPTKHKEENTFKFQTFSERLSSVNVDIVHRVDLKRNQLPEETETFFYECLEKWSDLNCTQGYTSFCRKLGRDVQSLAQLILHQEHISNVLLSHIVKENVDFLEPVLELVIAVTKDLQSEFYPSFAPFFKSLTDLLQIKDPDIIECTFKCLAFLYKNLWRSLIKDIASVYELLLPLLSSEKPEHVQQFASESFAFIGRKVPCKPLFIDLVFAKLLSTPENSQGVGQLLFNLVKGVKNQFHTSLGTFLPLYLTAVDKIDASYQDDPIYLSVEHCFLLMARHSSAAHSAPVWKVLMDHLSTNKPGLCVLGLLQQWVSFKEGELVADSVTVANTLLNLLKQELTTEQVKLVSSSTSSLIMSSKANLPLEKSTTFGPLLFCNRWEPQIVFDFTIQVAGYKYFESHLLSGYIRFCHSISSLEKKNHPTLLNSLAHLLASKTSIPKNGYEIGSYKQYPLAFEFDMERTSNHCSIPALLKSTIEQNIEDVLNEEFYAFVCALVCFPNVKPMDNDVAIKILKKVVSEVAGIIISLEADEPQSKRKKIERPADFVDRLGLIFSLAVLSAHCFSQNLKKDLPWELVQSTIVNEVTAQNTFFLRALDFYITHVSTAGPVESLDADVLLKLQEKIGTNVHSHNREIRLLTLHIMSLLNPPLPPPPENVVPAHLFKICFQAEMVTAGVREYREKLKFLQCLEADRIVFSIPTVGDFSKVPLQYLLSQLFVNFRPVWDPVLKLIETHASSMNAAEFWAVYFQFMEVIRHGEDVKSSHLASQFQFLNWTLTPERLDYFNVRTLVWQGLSLFGGVVEQHQNIVVPLFLDFWNKEYCVGDGNAKQFQDLKGTREEDVDVEEETKGKGKNYIGLLMSHLSVLSSFSNPQQMTRSGEVIEILNKLLSHRNCDVQKKALDCLIAFQYPFLVPYKDNLYRLLEEKSFRNELTLFSIDDSSSLVSAEHRAGLTPILLRILFGRMQNKTGPNSTGKQNIQQRQSLILRYVAGFSDPEIDVFLDLAFQMFRNASGSDDIYAHVKRLMAEADPTRALPLKRLQGALVLMGTIFSKLGNLMKSTVPKLLNILLSSCAHVNGLLAKRSEFESRYHDQLKNLRVLGMQRVTQFFSKFERYPWTPSELEALFHVCIWPQAEHLPMEGIHSPTPILRLFEAWSENSRYFVLFSKLHPEHNDMGVLPPLMALLSSPKTHPTVCSCIMGIVEKLVTTVDYGQEEDGEEIEMMEEPIFIRPDFCAEVAPNLPTDPETKENNFGSRLLIPHIEPVLGHLRKAMTHGLNSRDLTVLMRISEFVTQPDQSSELSKLIVPAIKAIANKSTKNGTSIEEMLTQYLNTLANLLKNAHKPHTFLGIFATLFGSIDGRDARRALISVLKVVCARDISQDNVPISEMVSNLNSWDTKRIDQPDYELRLSTHKQINAILEEGTPTYEWIIFVLYNCFHFVRTEEDTSLKDSASYTLQLATVTLTRLKCGKVVLNDHFLPQLRGLLQSKNETVRHEGVSILGKAVLNSPGMNSSLNSLRKLRKGDVETDFFENSRHLQTHRRSRALLRLTAILKSDQQTISGETITQFLLPLTTCYLFSETYEKQNHLIDASLECLQAISRCLSWYSYEKLLRYYLSNMTRQTEFQKQAVKAVVAILNGFHFDLRNSQFKSYYSNKRQGVVEETSMDVVDTEIEADINQTMAEPVAEEPEKLDSKKVLSVETATKIHSIIAQQLLPELNGILTARSKREMQHKSVKQDHFPEDDEILRVPIALALVSLMNYLPPGTLEKSLPGMFMKVCTFLKSRCDSVREVSRDTLIRMVLILGPKHLSTLMDAANPILQRGFQVHVYIFTMHSLLVKLSEQGQLKPGSLDPVIYPLVELCKKELYGDTADEKEVAQITSKVKEAKGIKAYDTLQIVAKYTSQSMLLPLILPMKDILASTKSFKMVRKVEECLMNMATGLVINQGLPVEPLFVFVHGVISLTIPQLKLPMLKVDNPDASEEHKPMRTDSMILEPTPKRRVAAAAQPATMSGPSKSAYVINSHLLVEFGYLTLNLLLKREKCHENQGTSVVLPMLDPFIPMVTESLSDSHSKLVALALRCISRLLHVPLPSITGHAPKICSALFTLLHKYAGGASGEYLEMIQSAFKTITVMIKCVTSHMIEADQLRVLLTYAEQTLSDPTQQDIGFGVLDAVMRRKLNTEELPEIIMNIAQLSITAEAPPMRAQCRKVVLKYLTHYPVGKAILQYMRFYLNQLEYEKEAGRLSAITFLSQVFKDFPKNFLCSNSQSFMIMLSPRLVEESSPLCVKAIVNALKNLLGKLNTRTAGSLFEVCMKWLTGENVLHQRMAVKLCGTFIAAEGAKFGPRLKEVLPVFIALLEPRTDDKIDDEDKDVDHLLIELLYAVTNLIKHCEVGMKNPELVDLTDDLWDKILQHLMHPHVWVRSLSARIVGHLLGWHKADEVASYAITPNADIPKTYLLCPELAARLRNLASLSVNQLQSSLLDDELAEQVVKNLIFVAKVANRIPATEGDFTTMPPTLPWLTGKLRREINAEVALRPTIPIKRLSVFKWMAAVAVDLNQVGGKDALVAVMKFFVPPLAREINDDGAPEEVRQLSQQVAECLKGLVGMEVYSELLMTANRKLATRRRDRKITRKADSVINPELAAKLKIKKHIGKQNAKKVKIAKLKGTKPKLRKVGSKK